jgi:hypothetical protein
MVKLRDRNHLYALPYTWSELHNFGQRSMLIITGRLRLMEAREIPPATSRADQT